MVAKLLSLIFLCVSSEVAGFVPQNHDSRSTSTSNSELYVDWFTNNGVEEARSSFPLWLFGATGSGGIARQAIPNLIDDLKAVRELKGVGPTLRGPTLGVSPLVGYPEDICIADAEKIVNNPLSIEEIVINYPIEGNFFSGNYLTLAAFEKANADANPLAVRAVFDSFKGAKVVEPEMAQSTIDEYKIDVSKVSANLNLARGKTFSAVFALLFLLGLADVATATDAYHGWFPDWPGGQNFPWRLLTEDGNPFTIPDYFVADIPE